MRSTTGKLFCYLVRFLQELTQIYASRKDPEAFRKDLLAIARTTLSSKVLAADKDYFAELAVSAVLRLKVCPCGQVSSDGTNGLLIIRDPPTWSTSRSSRSREESLLIRILMKDSFSTKSSVSTALRRSSTLGF